MKKNFHVRRFDVSRLDKLEIMSQGYLRAPCNATRVGIFTYKNADGSERKELRLPEEVFDKASMDSLAGIPVTNKHPAEQLLNAGNTKRYIVGYTATEISKDNKFLKTKVTVTDDTAINDVKGGRQELSCGYECELEEVPGVWQGQRYDCIQRNIRYNHLALVDNGRAGDEVRLRTDSSDAIQVTDSQGKEPSMGMKKVTVKGKEHDVPEEVANAHAALQQAHAKLKGKYDAATKVGKPQPTDKPMTGTGGEAEETEEEVEEEETELDGAEYDDASGSDIEEIAWVPTKGKNGSAARNAEKGKSGGSMGKPQSEGGTVPSKMEELAAKVDALTDENAKLKEKVKNDAADPKVVQSAVKARLRIEKVAHVCLDDEGKKTIDTLADLDLKKAVIKAEYPHVNLDDKSDVYVDVRFDTIAEQVDAKVKELGSLSALMEGKRAPEASASRNDGGMEEGSAEKKRVEAENRDKDAWKQTTGATRKAK